MEYKLIDSKKEKELIILESYKDKLAPAIFTERQLDVLRKKLSGNSLSQTEKNYLSNGIKAKFEALTLLFNNINLNEFISDIYERRNSLAHLNIRFNEIRLNQNASFDDDPNMRRMLRKILTARSIAFITGAGISKYSGLPIYRGEGGHWTRIDPLDNVSHEGFKKHPKKTMKILEEFKKDIDKSKPNIAHHTLAKMEKLFDSFTIITQNIDGYHQKAGNNRIFELHGNIHNSRKKNGFIIPDITLFNEEIDTKTYKYAHHAIMNCDILFIIGTSGYFEYIADLAKDCPGYIIEINPERTEISDLCDMHIRENAERILPRLYNNILKNILLREFRKHFESDKIKSIYLYGSLLNERRLPNDIDLLIVPKKNKKPSTNILLEIKSKIRHLTGKKADIEIAKWGEFQNSINEYKRKILFDGILLYGKNLRKEIFTKISKS